MYDSYKLTNYCNTAAGDNIVSCYIFRHATLCPLVDDVLRPWLSDRVEREVQKTVLLFFYIT